MKIAAISEDGINISQHFGRAPLYVIVTVEEGKVENKETRDKTGQKVEMSKGRFHHLTFPDDFLSVEAGHRSFRGNKPRLLPVQCCRS